VEQPAGEAAQVARAQADPTAFAPLYATYFDPIYRYCARRLGSHDAAADATSAVFANALAALPAYRDGSFRAWLFAIAHNVVTNLHRADRPQHALTDALHIADGAPSPEELAVAGDERRSLGALLAQLPPEQRRVVELRLAGLTGPEIGQLLGRSHGAIKVAQFRAMARLRDLALRASTTEGARHDEH